jgi:uncharacterized membrane protein YfcA
MPSAEALVLVALTALAASTLAAVAGFGGSVVMLPVLIWAFGIREAVPLLTVAQLVGNLARVFFNRRELVLPVVGWFAIGAMPAAVLGGVLFATAPSPLLTRLLGAFLLVSAAYRRTKLGSQLKLGERGFSGVGAVFGLLSALLGSVGALAAPFFLSYGLTGAAFIGTEALTAVLMHLVKLTVYGRYALVDGSSIGIGLAIGPVMIVGSYLGKHLLERVPEQVFPRIIEAVLVVSGLQLLLLG